MDLFKNIVILIVGMVLLIKGADYFVSGASNLAKKLKIPAIIIGLTVVSFGTSLPETSVSLFSALKGSADLSLGNVIGSNIFNTFIVLGASALMMPVIVKKSSLKGEMPFLLLVTIIIILFSIINFNKNYVISRLEGIILLTLFVFYLYMMILMSKKINASSPKEESSHINLSLSILILFLGLGGIILGGELVTNSASKIALELGMSEALVGLTIIAVGTSLPELVTSVIAAKKGENDIAFGNVIGSNIFNILLIIGLASTIQPLSVVPIIIIDMVIMLFFTIVLVFFVFKNKKIGRFEGIIFISMYMIYLVYIIIRNYVK